MDRRRRVILANATGQDRRPTESGSIGAACGLDCVGWREVQAKSSGGKSFIGIGQETKSGFPEGNPGQPASHLRGLASGGGGWPRGMRGGTFSAAAMNQGAENMPHGNRQAGNSIPCIILGEQAYVVGNLIAVVADQS